MRLKTLFQSRSRIAGGLVIALAVSACQSQVPSQNNAYLAANDYRLRHPIVVTEQPEILDLPVGAHMRTLNRDLTSTITAFGAQARKKGNGHVEILVPSGARNEAAVHAIVPKIRAALRQGGVPAGSISTRSYPVHNSHADAAVRLSYPRVMATAGPCGEWVGDFGGGINRNTDYRNFGCATQANLATMVDNPADLLTPRASAPADQLRRATVFEKYRAGEATAGQYTEGVGASVSED